MRQSIVSTEVSVTELACTRLRILVEGGDGFLPEQYVVHVEAVLPSLYLCLVDCETDALVVFRWLLLLRGQLPPQREEIRGAPDLTRWHRIADALVRNCFGTGSQEALIGGLQVASVEQIAGVGVL